MGGIIYKIIARRTGSSLGAYCRSYHNDYDFHSVDEARSANVHGLYKDAASYRVAKYRVRLELIDDDVGANEVSAPPEGKE